jgi:hypothetical protein
MLSVCMYPPYPLLNLCSWHLVSVLWRLSPPLRRTSDVLALTLCVSSMCIPLPLLGNGSVNTFPRHRMHATIEEWLDSSFSIWSMYYQRRVCGSACISPLLVYLPPKRWSEGSQSHQAVKYGHESRGTRNQESLSWRWPAAIYWTVLCPPIVARQRLGKHVPAATKNCRRRFLCGPCRIRGWVLTRISCFSVQVDSCN